MNVMVDSEETTCKLAKGTAAATDPSDLPDRIPAGGILEAQQNYLADNILAFCQPEFPPRIFFYGHYDWLISLKYCLLKMC